jgi:hypothetical protein
VWCEVLQHFRRRCAHWGRSQCLLQRRCTVAKHGRIISALPATANYPLQPPSALFPELSSQEKMKACTLDAQRRPFSTCGSRNNGPRACQRHSSKSLVVRCQAERSVFQKAANVALTGLTAFSLLASGKIGSACCRVTCRCMSA